VFVTHEKYPSAIKSPSLKAKTEKFLVREEKCLVGQFLLVVDFTNILQAAFTLISYHQKYKPKQL